MLRGRIELQDGTRLQVQSIRKNQEIGSANAGSVYEGLVDVTGCDSANKSITGHRLVKIKSITQRRNDEDISSEFS